MERGQEIKYYRMSTPDTDRLANLVFKARGERRNSEYAAILDIDPSTLSRILNARRSCGLNINLLRRIAETAAPNSGVTFELLCEANGMGSEKNQQDVYDSQSVWNSFETFLLTQCGIIVRREPPFSYANLRYCPFDYIVDGIYAFSILSPPAIKPKTDYSGGGTRQIRIVFAEAMMLAYIRKDQSFISELNFVTVDENEFYRMSERSEYDSVRRRHEHNPFFHVNLLLFDADKGEITRQHLFL